MSTVTITRFNNVKAKKTGHFRGKQGYSAADACIVPIDTDNRCHAIVDFIDNAVVQLRHGTAPSGISFCSWKGMDNKDTSFTAAYALALDYRLDRFDGLRERAAALGFAHLLITSENKARTLSAITLVIPFVAPVSKPTYERIASCIVTELGIYGLLEGALAVNHVINIHGTTMTAFERGALMDAEAYRASTARMYQGMDARKYESTAPAPAVAAQIERPFFTTNDGLFEMPCTDADMIVMRAHQAIHGTPPDLTGYGRLID